ncbi:HAD family acid phosphatase [Candidatus Omnitrophota bacterium]
MKYLPLGKKLTIAIDMDGTVANCSTVDFTKADDNPSELMKAKPIKGALQSVKKLHKQGHTIIFYTSRDNGCKKTTEKWLKKHGFPFHHIEMEKFVAHVYIDDRAINGCDWSRIMKEFKNPNLPGKIARKRGMV